MKKIFVKQMSLLVVAFMCLSMFGMLMVSASGETKVYYPPMDEVSARNLRFGSCDSIYESKGGTGEDISIAGSGIETYYDGWTSSTIKIGPEAADNDNVVFKLGSGTAFHTPYDTPSDAQRKYETKIKLSALTDKVYALATPWYPFMKSGYEGEGVTFENGNVWAYNPSSGTKVALDLSEDLQAGVWYKVVKYYDKGYVDGIDWQIQPTQRVLLYRIENNGTASEEAILIGDSGTTWVNLTALAYLQSLDTDYDRVGCWVESASGEVQFDEFNGYSLTSLTDSLGDNIDENSVISFNFSNKLTAADVEAMTISLDKAGTVNTSFIEGENRLDITLSGILYETDYTLTFSGNVAETSFTFSTGIDLRDAYRPEISLAESEKLSARNLKFDSCDSIYAGRGGAGEDISLTGSGIETYYDTWDSTTIKVGMEDAQTDNVVFKLGSGTAFHTPYNTPSDAKRKYETKIKLSALTDKVYALATPWHPFMKSGREGEGVTFENGNVWAYNPSDGGAKVALDLSEDLQAGVWYKVVKYYDKGYGNVSWKIDPTQRVQLYRIENNGTASEKAILIGDTGATWINLSWLDYVQSLDTDYDRVGCWVESASGEVQFDEFNGYALSTYTPLTDDTSILPGAVAFDFSKDMEASSLDATKVELTSGDDVIALTDVSFNEKANQLVVTFPELTYETNYTLTFKKDVMETIDSTYGALTMKEDKVFSFTTGADKFEVKAKKFVDANGEEISAEALQIGDVIKASVTVANTESTGGEYLIILALYGEDGSALEDIAVLPGKAVNTTAEGVTVTTTDSVTVTKAGCKASIMVWTNWSDITPRTMPSFLPAE